MTDPNYYANNRESVLAQQRERYRTDPDYRAAKIRRARENKRGPGTGDIEAPPLGTPCPICGRTDQILRYDHDHQTGAHRGWLCANCNAGLGLLGDSAPRIAKALDYLEGR